MNPSLFALLFACHALARKTSVSINEIVDLKLEMANRMSVANNRTTVEYGSGFVSNLFAYDGATGIGLDSLVRTGECEMVFQGDTITYVYHIGQSILATFFRKVVFGERSGSGYYRALNNSIEYSYTVSYAGARCSARLNALRLTLGHVEAFMLGQVWSSEDEEFGDDVAGKIVPSLNRKLELKFGDIESTLESIFCQGRGQQLTTQGLDVLRTFLF